MINKVTERLPDVTVIVTTRLSRLVSTDSLPLTNWRYGKYGGYGEGDDETKAIIQDLLAGRLMSA